MMRSERLVFLLATAKCSVKFLVRVDTEHVVREAEHGHRVKKSSTRLSGTDTSSTLEKTIDGAEINNFHTAQCVTFTGNRKISMHAFRHIQALKI